MIVITLINGTILIAELNNVTVIDANNLLVNGKKVTNLIDELVYC